MTAAIILTEISRSNLDSISSVFEEHPSRKIRTKYSDEVIPIMANEEGFRRKIETQANKNAGKGFHHDFFLPIDENPSEK